MAVSHHRWRGQRAGAARLSETSLPCQWLRGGVSLNHHTLSDARVSFTDPEAVVVMMPDGGFRPACNPQLALETGHGPIVGLDVTSTGAGRARLEPMVEQIVERTGRQPDTVLVDGGFFSRDSVTRLTRAGVELLMPLPKPRRRDRTPDQPVPDDTPQVAALRRRMHEAGIQERYRQRARRIEWTNAGYRNRGWRQVLVRGRDKVRAVAGWRAMAHTLRCILRAEALATVFGLAVFRSA